MNHADPLQHS